MSTPETPKITATTEPTDTQVLVIGAGLTGLLLAA